MSGPTDAEAQAVLRRYGLGAAAAEALGNRGGFSGARLWRVTTERGQFCLKAWPPGGGMEPRRHAGIVQILDIARRSGLAFVPAVMSSAHHVTHVEHADRMWDLADWMPGVADFHANPSPTRLAAACTALARLHRTWEEFASPPRTCPAVIRRLVNTTEWLDATGCDPFVPVTAAADPLSPWVEPARTIVAQEIWNVRQLLEPWRNVPLPVQPCLCDVWHDHVLFTDDEVTGLIDYGAVKLDHVAVDSARLLGSLVGENRRLYELGLDVYSSIRRLTNQERELVRTLDYTGVVLALANWLRRLFHLGERPSDRHAVARRMAQLVERAERLSASRTGTLFGRP